MPIDEREREEEEEKTMEGDKSCRAVAGSWFKATDEQTTIVFTVHFKGGGVEAKAAERHTVTFVENTIRRFVFPGLSIQRV